MGRSSDAVPHPDPLLRIWRACLVPDALLTLAEASEALPGDPAENAAWLEAHVRPVRTTAAGPLFRWGDVIGRPAPSGTPSLLTADQLAAELQVPVSTVHRWTSDRTIPCFKLGHKTVRYSLTDVLAAAEQTTAAVEEHPHGRHEARRPLARRLPLHRPEHGESGAIPPYDWSQHDKARG